MGKINVTSDTLNKNTKLVSIRAHTSEEQMDDAIITNIQKRIQQNSMVALKNSS